MAVELRSKIEALNNHFEHTYCWTREDESYWQSRAIVLSPNFQEDFLSFLRFSIPHFPDTPDQKIFQDVIIFLRSHDQFQSTHYLELFQTIIEDSATIGFNHLDRGFNEIQVLRPHNSPYEPEMLFALRVYLSDVLVQTSEIKSQALQKACNLLQQPHTTLLSTAIPAILGTFFPVQNGSVIPLRNPAYVRRGYSGIYIPDLESATLVCEYLGAQLGRPLHTNRADTFKKICDEKNLATSLAQLKEIDPLFEQLCSRGLRFPFQHLQKLLEK